jgi:glycerol-3-phosphate dehydrogenase
VRRVRRADAWAKLSAGPFDLCVVGGGIVGVAVARDAALRGLRVALLERVDFACGTSSRTSRMLHGGVRYLRQGRIGLVRQALRERNLLRDRAGGLVRPTAFAVPVFRESALGPGLTRLGLRVYRSFARDANVSWLGPARADEAAPGLRREGLRGIGGYRDVLVRDARLVVEVARGAEDAGAVVVNHAPVEGLLHEDGKVAAALVTDGLSGGRTTVRATCVVNASGPWADAVRRMDDPHAEPMLRPTKGIHVFVPHARLAHTRAVVLETRDGRVVFVLPWGRLTLVGTTDTDYDGPLDEVVATAADVAYLLDEVNAFFPEARLTPDDVVSSFAGVRPLVWHGESRGSASDISRTHEIAVSPTGLVTVAGGKLTTHRAMAEEVVDRVVDVVGRGEPCRTAKEPLRADDLPRADYESRLASLGLPADVAAALADTYRSAEMLPLLADPALRERLVPDLPHVAAEVVHAARHEWAATLEDVFSRRTGVLLESVSHGADCADRAADLLAAELGWTADVRARLMERYREAVARTQAFR